MLSLSHKYRRKYAFIALFSYLFLVSLTIFHYHHVDIQEGNYAINCQGEEGQTPFDKLIDATHECTIQQFASTVIDYSFTSDLNIVRNNSPEEFISDEIVTHSFTPHYISNPHRGPPSII